MKLSALIGLLMGICAMPLMAQEQDDKDSTQQTPPKVAATSVPQPQVSSSEILQLEATIRASKEQPKVLSIVPWQLPLHSRIDGKAPDLFTPPQLKPLYRGAFVREQVLYEKLFKSTSDSQ